MKRTSAGSKILRVGVIQGGKIVEERHVRRPDSVSVGQDAKNTFVIPASNLPPSFPVFDFRGTHYYLLFTERMDGRVRIGDKDLDFGLARPEAGPEAGQRLRAATRRLGQGQGVPRRGDASLSICPAPA